MFLCFVLVPSCYYLFTSGVGLTKSRHFFWRCRSCGHWEFTRPWLLGQTVLLVVFFVVLCDDGIGHICVQKEITKACLLYREMALFLELQLYEQYFNEPNKYR